MRILTAPLCLLLLSPAAWAEVDVELQAGATGTSNLYLERDAEADLVLRPAAALEAGLSGDWVAGYEGELLYYVLNTDLLAHRHHGFLLWNPAWGEEDENEALVQLGVDTVLNTSDHSSMNLLRPRARGALALEPSRRFRVELDADVSYRRFPSDPSVSSVDAFAGGRLVFQAPGRISLSPRAVYGVRRFTGRGTLDKLDQQVDAGVRVGKNLSEGLGLSLDVGYRLPIGPSGLIERKVTQDQFEFLGEDFLFGGLRGELALKRAGEKTTVVIGGYGETRDYAGWPALDSAGVATGEDRADVRVGGRLAVTRELGESLRLEAEAGGFRQMSNSYLYDATVGTAGLALVATFE
jgi:hypothetical protein